MNIHISTLKNYVELKMLKKMEHRYKIFIAS